MKKQLLNIQHRKSTDINDKFYTPLPLAIKLIEMTNIQPLDIVLDPSKGLGVFYDNLPECSKDWCEIEENIDFYKYTNNVDVIIGNPPFSQWTKWIKKTIELNPKKIAYVIGCLNLTKSRIKLLQSHNYFLTKFTIVSVNKWFSQTYLVVFEKNATPIIDLITENY